MRIPFSLIFLDQLVAKETAHGAILGFEGVLGGKGDASLFIVAGGAPFICFHFASGFFDDLVERTVLVIVGYLMGFFLSGDSPKNTKYHDGDDEEEKVFFSDTHK